ncbi:MAG: general secretion pathway protein GspD, partial [Comamonadaceae bacterium CG17_big_fil_post_rev_8_21_14_2_50_60_13]
MTESRLPSPVSAARVASLLAVSLLLGACSTDRPLRTPSVSEAIRTEVPMPAAPAAVVPARVADALAEPTPPAVPVPPEPRIDLLVNNAPVRQVFLAMVADTRYSMLMHPDVAGTLSVTLRGVTVTEALEAIRDVYGYDFKIEGRRITVYAPTLQTRMFTVNYPNSQRSGNSDLRVASGGSSQGTTSGSSSASTTTNNSTPSTEGSRIST